MMSRAAGNRAGELIAQLPPVVGWAVIALLFLLSAKFLKGLFK